MTPTKRQCGAGRRFRFPIRAFGQGTDHANDGVYLVVFLGAGIGGALRYSVSIVATRYLMANVSAGTWLVNIIGSTVIGALAGYSP